MLKLFNRKKKDNKGFTLVELEMRTKSWTN